MNNKAIDGWSPIHWFCGFLLGWFCVDFGIDLMYVVLALMFFEIVEYLWLGKWIFEALGVHDEESSINVLSDLFWGFFGALFAFYIFM